MRALWRWGRGSKRRERARVVAPASALRLTQFLPNRTNRHWWIGGALVAIILTRISLPYHQRVVDVTDTERQRQIARSNTAPIYTLDPRGLSYAKSVFGRIEDVLTTPGLTLDERLRAIDNFPLARLHLRGVDLSALFRYEALLPPVREHTLRILGQVLGRGIVLADYGEGTLRGELSAYFDPKYTTAWENVDEMRIYVQPSNRHISIRDTLTMEEAVLEIERYVRTLPPDPNLTARQEELVAQLILVLANPSITPNLVYNEEATSEARERNAATVRTVYRQRQGTHPAVYAGTLCIVGLMMVLAGMFLWSQTVTSRPSARQLAAFGLMLVVAVALLRAVTWAMQHPNLGWSVWVDYPVLLIPVATTAALSSILLGVQFGIVSTVFLTVIAALMVGASSASGVPQFLTLLAAGFLTTHVMMGVHRRRDLAFAGLYTSVVAMLIVFGATLMQADVTNWEMLRTVGWAFAAGLLVTAVVPGVLPPFEYIAGTASDLELLDLSDLNHPLLLQMRKVAPGTFNHSLNVSRLAEAAAEVVGANALLARVGAYYHDIGKMQYPQYFIENQGGGPNPHDRLTPTMSVRVLVAHVKDGVELAKEHSLPGAIIDLVEQHHGASLIRPFYRKAVDQGDPASESDFRSPGPKPQTKVAAIMMLADSIEAAANARFKNASELGRRECDQLVNDIVSTYVLDHQLEECDLTLNDLRLTSDRFERSLLAMYHSRIDYP
ncbi:HDIG domain-containing protein, partial [Candidatus Poribacteria bacterium]|nr:HDIG domain-containing protein [Candidatus Poribacteria bacterium]